MMQGSATFLDHEHATVPDGSAYLTADEVGVHVNAKSPWLNTLVRRSVMLTSKPFPPVDLWYSPWDQIISVRAATQSVVLENSQRDRCLFGATDETEMSGFLAELTARGIPVQNARSVYWDQFRPRRRSDR